LLALFLTL